MKKYDVAIVGAGPAGLFCAYELKEKKPKLKVALIDKGHRAETRMCPMKVMVENVLTAKYAKSYQDMVVQEHSQMEN